MGQNIHITIEERGFYLERTIPISFNSNPANPLGCAPVGSLIAKFAVPAIISMLVNALYNIVDQIFIGQGVGMFGNAATNIAFPVTTISTAAACSGNRWCIQL